MSQESENKRLPTEAEIAEEIFSEIELEKLELVKKLKELYDLGAITKEEFEQKKNELLGIQKRLPPQKRTLVIGLWASLGFTAFSYLVNVIISLNVGGNLFWMFDYIMYGYIAGFLLMAIGIAGYIAFFRLIRKDKETVKVRIISLVLLIALLTFTFSPLVFHEPCTYSANGFLAIGQTTTTYSVTGCEFRRVNVKIRSTYNGSPVTTIGYSAFANRDKLKKVEIPDSVTAIYTQAFASCDSLTKIVIPDSVTSISEGAFLESYSLVIFCEAESKPDGFADGWNCSYTDYGNPNQQTWRYLTVYWAGEWEYDWRGNPVPLS